MVGLSGSARLKRHCPSYCLPAKLRHVPLRDRVAFHGGGAPRGPGTSHFEQASECSAAFEQQQLHKSQSSSPPDRSIPLGVHQQQYHAPQRCPASSLAYQLSHSLSKAPINRSSIRALCETIPPSRKFDDLYLDLPVTVPTKPAHLDQRWEDKSGNAIQRPCRTLSSCRHIIVLQPSAERPKPRCERVHGFLHICPFGM